MTRAVSLILAAVTLVVAAARPVWAHGGANVDASLQSVVLSTPAGLRAWVHADGSLVTVEKDASAGEVTVLGYSGEPFLRLAGGSVFDNANSLTSYAARSGLLDEVPAGAGHGPVRWERRQAGRSYSWTDERTAWADPQLPAAVMAAPDKRHELGGWSIPVLVGGTRGAITGRFVWVPTTVSAGATIAAVGAFIAVVLGLAGYVVLRRPATR